MMPLCLTLILILMLLLLLLLLANMEAAVRQGSLT